MYYSTIQVHTSMHTKAHNTGLRECSLINVDISYLFYNHNMHYILGILYRENRAKNPTKRNNKLSIVHKIYSTEAHDLHYSRVVFLFVGSSLSSSRGDCLHRERFPPETGAKRVLMCLYTE